MPKGGARPRSGPERDPQSRTSERRRKAEAKAAADDAKQSGTSAAVTTPSFTPTALPARGRAGNPPAYPLPKIVRHIVVMINGKPAKVADAKAGTAFRKRELGIWRSIWKTPQALAWERDPWRWPRVALYCRLTTVVELEPDSNAALVSRQRELANEIGLTPDGLRMNGWAIAPDQLAAKRAQRPVAKDKPAERSAPVRRLRG